MKTLKLTLVLALCMTVMTAAAQRKILHYDFSRATSTTVEDRSGSHVTAELKNGAEIRKIGRNNVLYLGTSDGYLDMTAQAGRLLKGVDDFSVSVYYYIPETVSLNGYGFFLWAFSTHEACGATDGKFFCYRINAQRIETSTGGYTREIGYEVGKPSGTGRWIHVAYTLEDGLGKLYIDGEFIAEVPNTPLNSVNFDGETIGYCWLGRPPFNGDNYLEQALIGDIRLYDGALSEKKIGRLAAKRTTF